MSDISQSLANDPALLIPIVAVGGGLLVAMVAIVFGSLKSISLHSEREKTRREIAAYIAEGSMTPVDGERLINAGNSSSTT